MSILLENIIDYVADKDVRNELDRNRVLIEQIPSYLDSIEYSIRYLYDLEERRYFSIDSCPKLVNIRDDVATTFRWILYDFKYNLMEVGVELGRNWQTIYLLPQYIDTILSTYIIKPCEFLDFIYSLQGLAKDLETKESLYNSDIIEIEDAIVSLVNNTTNGMEYLLLTYSLIQTEVTSKAHFLYMNDVEPWVKHPLSISVNIKK